MRALFEKIFKLSVSMILISAMLLIILGAFKVKGSLLIPIFGITFIASCIIAVISGIISSSE